MKKAAPTKVWRCNIKFPGLAMARQARKRRCEATLSRPVLISQDGLTPLGRAVRRCDLDIARLLLVHGADPSSRDKVRPIVDPCRPMGAGIASAALPADARPTSFGPPLRRRQQPRGSTWHGMRRPDNGLLAFAGSRSQDGEAPLDWAARGRQVALVRLLLDHGADASAKDEVSQWCGPCDQLEAESRVAGAWALWLERHVPRP